MSIKEIKIDDLQISPLNVRSILKDDIDELSKILINMDYWIL